MYGPNTPKEESEELLPEWHEPFPEPNTIPSGWNFSSNGPMSAAPSEMDAEESAED